MNIEATQFFKCLSDATRLKATLLIFKEGELCVCELMEAFNESQPKISRHLAQLRGCGLLKDSRRGQWVYYSVNPDLPGWTLKVLEELCRAEGEALAQFQNNLCAMQGRPSCC